MKGFFREWRTEFKTTRGFKEKKEWIVALILSPVLYWFFKECAKIIFDKFNKKV